jgi:hypothetical protein
LKFITYIFIENYGGKSDAFLKSTTEEVEAFYTMSDPTIEIEPSY